MPGRVWYAPAIGLAAVAVTVAPIATSSAFAATGSVAGYQVTAGTDTSVSASWTVPALSCGTSVSTANTAIGLGTNADGVDGALIGIDASCSSGVASYQAWYTYALPQLLSHTVVAGDSVSASVSYTGDVSTWNEYALTLTDHTQNWSQTEDIYSSSFLDTSAVVAVEPLAVAPVATGVPIYTLKSEALANFGTVDFTGAEINSGPVGDTAPELLDLVSGSGVTDAVTSALDSTGEDFSVNWQSSN